MIDRNFERKASTPAYEQPMAHRAQMAFNRADPMTKKPERKRRQRRGRR